jgi:hypothetical protein
MKFRQFAFGGGQSYEAAAPDASCKKEGFARSGVRAECAQQIKHQDYDKHQADHAARTAHAVTPVSEAATAQEDYKKNDDQEKVHQYSPSNACM